GEYGFDPRRVYLAGHSAGGHLASLVALDRSYLKRQGLAAGALAGVISISGLYDLAPSWPVSDNQTQAVQKTFGGDPKILRQASPITFVRAAALRRAGAQSVEQWMLKGADHFSIVRLDDENHPVRRALLAFMGVKALAPPLADIVAAQRRWNDPPYSSVPFWRFAKLVRSYPVDERF